MKNHKTLKRARAGAAVATLSLLALSSFSAVARSTADNHLPEITIPALPDEEAYFNKIKEAFRQNLAEAPFLMKEFLNRYPASQYRSEVTLMLADLYFFEKEYPLALKYYTELRDNSFSGDTREEMLYRKALSQIKTGYYTEAAGYLKELRNSSEFGEDARFYLAYIDYVNGNYDEAYNQFLRIQSAGPKGAEAEYYTNQIEYLRGNYQKVATTSERLLTSGSTPDELMAETMRVAGLANFKLGSTAMARNILQRYADLTGDGAEISALYSLATIYYDEGNHDKALPLFSVVTEYPGNLAQSAWLYIGQIHTAKGDAATAALAFDKAAKESWDNDVAEAAAYNLAVSSTDGPALPFGDAAAAMESFIDTYPGSPYARSLSNYLANAYYSRRNYKEALRQLDRIANPDDSAMAVRQKILYQLGVSELQQGRLTDAIQDLTAASSRQAVDKEVAAQAGLWLGDAYYVKKDYPAAAKAYKAALASGKLGANSALASYNLGYACMKLKNYKEAEEAFKTASNGSGLTTEQKNDALLRYGDCLYYTGKYSEALAVFRNVKLSGGSEGVFARIREADILGRNGSVNDKISILENLYAGNDAGIWRSTVISRLADAYSEKGDDRKAAKLYAEMLDASDGNADNSEIYYSLAVNADNLYKSGDKKAAFDAYKRLEASGIDALYPAAVTGIMRTSPDNAEVISYAAKAASLPGISADEANEARFTGAQAALATGSNRQEALASLRALAESSDRLWGARAAVVLGESLLKDGDTAGAESVLLDLIDKGGDENYWMAKGYIALADVYSAQKKDYLAKLYLETLRDNYPGKETEIRQMISSRLNKLAK